MIEAEEKGWAGLERATVRMTAEGTTAKGLTDGTGREWATESAGVTTEGITDDPGRDSELEREGLAAESAAAPGIAEVGTGENGAKEAMAEGVWGEVTTAEVEKLSKEEGEENENESTGNKLLSSAEHLGLGRVEERESAEEEEKPAEEGEVIFLSMVYPDLRILLAGLAEEERYAHFRQGVYRTRDRGEIAALKEKGYLVMHSGEVYQCCREGCGRALTSSGALAEHEAGHQR